jgi:hypothetical protein
MAPDPKLLAYLGQVDAYSAEEIAEWAESYGITSAEVREYIKQGWDPDHDVLCLDDDEPFDEYN